MLDFRKVCEKNVKKPGVPEAHRIFRNLGVVLCTATACDVQDSLHEETGLVPSLTLHLVNKTAH